MEKDIVNISEQTDNYAKELEKNTTIERNVIQALNTGRIKKGDKTLGGIYCEVWKFFTQMYEKRRQKFRFFNFLYKSSFKKAYENANKQGKSETEKLEFLLQTAGNTNKRDSILSLMNENQIKTHLEKYSTQNDEVERKTNAMDNFENEYAVIKSIWSGVIAFIQPGTLSRATIYIGSKRNKLEENGKMDVLAGNLQSTLVNIKDYYGDYDHDKAKNLKNDIEKETDKLNAAKTREEKKQVIETLYKKYETKKNEKQ